jgi:hypothetical protein
MRLITNTGATSTSADRTERALADNDTSGTTFQSVYALARERRSERVRDALVGLAEDPHASTGLRRLAGRPESRLRVGAWRVLLVLQAEERVILAMWVRHFLGEP